MAGRKPWINFRRCRLFYGEWNEELRAAMRAGSDPTDRFLGGGLDGIASWTLDLHWFHANDNTRPALVALQNCSAPQCLLKIQSTSSLAKTVPG
jgi:hypothetical protein